MKKEQFYVEGMSCKSCKTKIEQCLNIQAGIKQANVNLQRKQLTVYYDETVITEKTIKQLLSALGYHLQTASQQKMAQQQTVLVLILSLVAYVLINRLIPDSSSLLSSGKNLSFIILFMIGVTTSFHCVSMCGGLALSQVMSSKNNQTRNLQYNIGRVMSYTILGGIVGGIGSAITIDYAIFKYVPLILGFFMILFGLEKLSFFSFQTIEIFKPFSKKLNKLKAKLSHDRGPFILGLLNGFMPCGPLQLMQIYALGTGSATLGAISMFAFSLGTVPLMLGLGVLVEKLSHQSRLFIFKFGGALIILIGLNMMSSSLATIGISSAVDNSNTDVTTVIDADGYQVIEFDLQPRDYQNIVVSKDIPVKIKIHANQRTLNGCNRSILIPAFNIEQTLEVGTTEIIFTPNKTGNFTFTCWMGMIRNTITVV